MIYIADFEGMIFNGKFVEFIITVLVIIYIIFHIAINRGRSRNTRNLFIYLFKLVDVRQALNKMILTVEI